MGSEIPWNIIAASCGEEAERYCVADTTRNTRGIVVTMYEINSLGFRGIGTGAPRPRAPDVALWPAIREAITDVRYAYDCLWSGSRSRSIYIYMRAFCARRSAAAAEDPNARLPWLWYRERSREYKSHKSLHNICLSLFLSFSFSDIL